ISGTIAVRGGVENLGSDTSFVQVHGTGTWYRPFGVADRLIVRGEAGTTWTGELVAMPPSLRFFAGGDRSIRGYAWREVGPRTPPPDNFALGARRVVTASVEYEHYFKGGPWGGAAFVDAGDAFDDDFSPRVGIGIGARWRSPVGPVRIDIAHGLMIPTPPSRPTRARGPTCEHAHGPDANPAAPALLPAPPFLGLVRPGPACPGRGAGGGGVLAAADRGRARRAAGADRVAPAGGFLADLGARRRPAGRSPDPAQPGFPLPGLPLHGAPRAPGPGHPPAAGQAPAPGRVRAGGRDPQPGKERRAVRAAELARFIAGDRDAAGDP